MYFLIMLYHLISTCPFFKFAINNKLLTVHIIYLLNNLLQNLDNH